MGRRGTWIGPILLTTCRNADGAPRIDGCSGTTREDDGEERQHVGYAVRYRGSECVVVAVRVRSPRRVPRPITWATLWSKVRQLLWTLRGRPALPPATADARDNEPAQTTPADEAVDFARSCGLQLTDRQEATLRLGLGADPYGWTAREFVLVSDDKDAVLTARALAGLFLLDETEVLHTTRYLRTTISAALRLLDVIEGDPALSRNLGSVVRGYGHYTITTRSGSRARFFNRRPDRGRGRACDCLILDDATDLPEGTLLALVPTVAGAPNGQLWFAAEPDEAGDGHSLDRARKRAATFEPRTLLIEQR